MGAGRPLGKCKAREADGPSGLCLCCQRCTEGRSSSTQVHEVLTSLLLSSLCTPLHMNSSCIAQQ